MKHGTDTTRERLTQALDRNVDLPLDRDIAIYGAGLSSRLSVPELPESFSGRVKYFIDDTPSKQGTMLLGKPVISFEEAHERCKAYYILLGVGDSESCGIMRRSLEKSPIENASFCGMPEVIYCTHPNEVLAVYDMLEDEQSRETYANLILYRMGLEQQNVQLVDRDAYFGLPEFYIWTDKAQQEVFVDCGAYVGDTIEQYLAFRLGACRKIVAFEPSERTFSALTARTERLKKEWALSDGQIQLVMAGIGEKSCRLAEKEEEFEQTDMRASSVKMFDRTEVNSGGIRICSIDEFFANEPVTFLKADIEGFEMPMLCGAERTIKRDHPKLAVCIYHSPVDMYQIALKIKNICPDYHFKVRQHSYSHLETVLYAY